MASGWHDRVSCCLCKQLESLSLSQTTLTRPTPLTHHFLAHPHQSWTWLLMTQTP
jgi:hypothetical protein